MTLLTLEEVAQILRVSDDTVRRLVKQKQLTGIKVGRLWRFTETALSEYLESRSVYRKAKKPFIDIDKIIKEFREKR